MEVWGGLECSINRVGENYFDQFSYDGLYEKPELLEDIIGLGINTLRFPVLWEKNQPDITRAPNWVVEKHLQLLEQNNIRIIAGLVHHGSGPSYSNIADPAFPEQLASYAKMVAEKFPWINDYTPVNEPLTTARFCGLYGFWHPHGRDSSTFLQILLHQCKATILAMQAIRTVNPGARLIFTEDLAQTHGSMELQLQIDFENQRRWLSIDLICGKVDNLHPLWVYLLDQNISEAQLDFFIQNPCPPEVLGFNYYITSERYLDLNLQDHPCHTHGGNGISYYADIEAVRHPLAAVAGIKNLLAQAYQRYQLPMAITEAQLCCGREDQLRWLKGIWDSCTELNDQHIPITAVTFWSLFGAYGWDKLLTSEKGNYEPGAFDLSSGLPRLTAIARLITSLSASTTYEHPLLKGTGWWQQRGKTDNSEKPVLILGGTGTLGSAFQNICADRNIPFIAPNRKKCDISDIESITEAINRYNPWAIINAAGYVNVEAAETNVETCLQSNTLGPIRLAKICRERNIQLMSFSSDLVFNGENPGAYDENAIPRPLNVYGYSKAEAERHLMEIDPAVLIIRTSAFFGPWDNYNFVTIVLRELQKGTHFSAMDDVTITATYIPHLVHAALDLLIDQQKGIWHLASSGKTSWYHLARSVASKAGLDPDLIQRISQADSQLTAKRPVNSALTSIKGKLMPDLENALDEYFAMTAYKSQGR